MKKIKSEESNSEKIETNKKIKENEVENKNKEDSKKLIIVLMKNILFS